VDYRYKEKPLEEKDGCYAADSIKYNIVPYVPLYYTTDDFDVDDGRALYVGGRERGVCVCVCARVRVLRKSVDEEN